MQKNKSYLGVLGELPTIRAEEFANWPFSDSKEKSTTTSRINEPADCELTGAELRYIRAVVDHPNIGSSKLPKHAGLSPRRAQLIREKLVLEGYLREHTIETGKRGRATRVMEPLKDALEALDRGMVQ